MSDRFMDTHKPIDEITREQYRAIKSAVLRHHKCVNEDTVLDILFVIEYIFGFKNSSIPDEYMIDILNDIFLNS
jgi:hypothetical protein